MKTDTFLILLFAGLFCVIAGAYNSSVHSFIKTYLFAEGLILLTALCFITIAAFAKTVKVKNFKLFWVAVIILVPLVAAIIYLYLYDG